MRKTTGLVGAVAIGSGLMVAGAPAYADSAGDNGINLLNGNNVSVAPTQLCNQGSIDVGSGIVHLGSDDSSSSPHGTDCVNAPVIDHPKVTRSQEPPPMPGPVVSPVPRSLPLAPEPVAVPGHHAVTG